MDLIIHPTYYATTESGETRISKNLVELTDWGNEELTDLLIIRRFDQGGSIKIQPVFVYERVNGRQIRVW